MVSPLCVTIAKLPPEETKATPGKFMSKTPSVESPKDLKEQAEHLLKEHANEKWNDRVRKAFSLLVTNVASICMEN